MPGRQIHTEAFVLARKPPADRFQQLTVFSGEHGGLLCLSRLPGRSGGTAPQLDLFDEADLWIESSNEGRTWFIKEARVRTRHESIGHGYDALRLASVFAGIIARNPVHEESRAGVYELLRRTFGAFGASRRPDLVYLKALYCFARDEGYPVKQEWWEGLPGPVRAAASEMLDQPLADQAPAPETVAGLTRRLEDYLRAHTEILLG